MGKPGRRFERQNVAKCLMAGQTVLCIDQQRSGAVQYRYLIPAPVDQTSASAWLYKNPWITCQRNKPSTSMTQVACETNLCSVVRSSMHPCPGHCVAIGHAVVYFAEAFSAGIKCQHCSNHVMSSGSAGFSDKLMDLEII